MINALLAATAAALLGGEAGAEVEVEAARDPLHGTIYTCEAERNASIVTPGDVLREAIVTPPKGPEELPPTRGRGVLEATDAGVGDGGVFAAYSRAGNERAIQLRIVASSRATAVTLRF